MRRLELNNRASIDRSSEGGVIHVMENNIASETTSDHRKGTDSIVLQQRSSPYEEQKSIVTKNNFDTPEGMHDESKLDTPGKKNNSLSRK